MFRADYNPAGGMGTDTRPGLGRALGELLSARFRLPTGAPPQMHLAITQAMLAIDRVHGIPAGSPIVRVIVEALDNAEGQYVDSRHGGPELIVDPEARFPRLVATHEVAHYIADELFVPGEEEAGFQRLEFGHWRQAVHATEAVERLRAEQWHMQDMLSGRQPAQFRIQTLLNLLGTLTYGLRDSELFARSYTQLITTESGEATLRQELAAHLARASTARLYLPGHWEVEDFASVHQAMRELLRNRRWIA